MQPSKSSSSSARTSSAASAWIASILCAEYLPVTWRSVLTGGCIERGTEVWNGGANYYTVAQIVVGGVDAANGLMAVKNLVFDEKKMTMAELKKALAANFEGEYENVRKMCYEAPKHGNDIPEVNKLVRRVYDSIYHAFQNVDGGGNYISKDIKSAPDCLHQEHPQPDGYGDRGAAHRQDRPAWHSLMEVCRPCRVPMSTDLPRW